MPILTLSTYFKTALIDTLSNQTKYTDWSNRIFIVNITELNNRRDLYDRSAMYLTIERLSDRLVNVQKIMQIKGYRAVERGIMKAIVIFPVNQEFPFIERLNNILHRMKSSGLYNYLQLQQDMKDSNKILKLNRDYLGNKTETIGNSDMFPIFIAYGWFVGIVLFVVEIIWFRTSRYFNSN